MHCGKLRFRFRHAIALALYSDQGETPRRSRALPRSAGSDAASELAVVLPSGEYAPAIVSGSAQISDVYVEPDGNVLVQFAVPTSLAGPIAHPTLEQLCQLAEIDVATGVPSCLGNATIGTNWPLNVLVPPYTFGSDGAIYFGGSPRGGGAASTYRFKDGQTVDLTPQPDLQTSMPYPGPPMPLANGQVLLPVPSSNADIVPGLPYQALWLLTPNSSGSEYSAQQITPSGWLGDAWLLPDGNVDMTSLQANATDCPLAQISAETGQIDPSYCPGVGGGDATQALESALTGYDPQLLTTAGGQAWVVGKGEVAELYPNIQVFTAPTSYLVTSGPGTGDTAYPGYTSYVAGDDLILTVSDAAGPAIYSFDTTTDVWTELFGADANADAPLPSGLSVSAVTYDATDDETLLVGSVGDGALRACAVNQATGVVTQLIGATLNAPLGADEGLVYVLYDPSADTLSYVDYRGSDASGWPSSVQYDRVTVNVDTGSATRSTFTLPAPPIWPPEILPFVAGSEILWPATQGEQN